MTEKRDTGGCEPTAVNAEDAAATAAEQDAARELVRQARAQGVALTGPGGLLKALTKTVIETALGGGDGRASGL